MATEVIMPALEMSQESGLLVQWLKSEGEFVAQGEPLMEIETDKAVMEIEASAAGILSGVTAQPGDEVPVGQIIGWLLEKGEKLPSVQPESKPKLPQQTDPARTDFPEGKDRGPASERPKTGKVRASPRARRMARELEIDLSEVIGSGPGGAILPSDLAGAGASPSPQEIEKEKYHVVPLKGTRRTVAQRTQKSYRTAPHISLSMAIDAAELLERSSGGRRGAAEQQDRLPGLTPLLLKSVTTALLQHPRLNAHLVDEEIREFQSVHLGVAVALEEGLVVAVLRNTEKKEALELQSELKNLVTRAQERRLQIEEMQGSTFTVSNLGMYGINNFTSILNLPEVGILSVGAVSQTPVSVDGEVMVRPRMNVTLNADHRAVDGAVAAQFLQTLRELAEHPPASS